MGNKVFSSFMWRFLERFGAQGVTFVVGIVLARILDPEVYGTIALVTVFTTILQVFVDSGLGTALIQKKDADDLDFSSVFWFNLLICIALYIGMFYAAPLIALYYERDDLVPVIRVLSLILIISGVKNIQQAYVSRNLLFKKFFFATLGGTVGAAVIGISLAYLGFGVWALIAQYLFNAFVDTVILWFTVKWRPKLIFSFERFKVLFSFGWKMLFSNLIDTIYTELRSLIIGKYYSPEDLAYYTKGSAYPKYAVESINSAMNSVLLPVLAKKQDDLAAVKDAARKVIRMSSYLIWPMMIGLCVAADKFIIVLLKEKWLDAAVYMRIMCIALALQPLQTTNLSVIKALGRADIHLKLEITKKIIAIGIVLVSSLYGVEAIAYGTVVYSVIASVLNAFPNKKLIQYSYLEQICDILPFIALSCAMGVCVWWVGFLPLSPLILFILQIGVGVIVYLLGSLAIRIDTLDALKDIVMKLFSKEAEK